jgi:hypothetical protein
VRPAGAVAPLGPTHFLNSGPMAHGIKKKRGARSTNGPTHFGHNDFALAAHQETDEATTDEDDWRRGDPSLHESQPHPSNAAGALQAGGASLPG